MFTVDVHPPNRKRDALYTVVACSTTPVSQVDDKFIGDKGLLTSYPAESQQTWKDKKYGYVPDEKRKNSVWGRVVAQIFDNYKERVSGNPTTEL